MLLEHEVHFNFRLSKVLYIHRYATDNNVKMLKEKLDVPCEFLDYFPTDLDNYAIDNCVICLDDYDDVLHLKAYAKIVTKFANYINHHVGTCLFLITQSQSIFYAKHPLNAVISQCTGLILFRSMTNMNILKKILNSFDVKLLSENETLYNIFRKYVNSCYKYLWVNLTSTLPSALVYSNVLFCDKNPLIMFT